MTPQPLDRADQEGHREADEIDGKPNDGAEVEHREDTMASARPQAACGACKAGLTVVALPRRRVCLCECLIARTGADVNVDSALQGVGQDLQP